MTEAYPGDIRITRGPLGPPVIDVVNDGPMRVSVLVITGTWERLADGFVTFLGQSADDGEALELRYRVVGVESGGEGGAGWLLCEPAP